MHGSHSTHTLPGSTVTLVTSERQEDALDRIADQLEIANKMFFGVLAGCMASTVALAVTAIWVVMHLH